MQQDMDKQIQDALGPLEFLSSEMLVCLGKIYELVDYKISMDYRAPFLDFKQFITNPNLNYISSLRTDPKKEHWYHALVNGIVENVQGSLSCMLYHQDRIIHIERALIRFFQEFNFKGLPKNGELIFQNTSILDFEYQAYVLAFRRCLDQLSCALAAFFKNKHGSFRTLPKFLEHRKPREIANKLTNVHTKYVNSFEFVLSDSGVTSVRDRIAHYEFVHAGRLSVSSKGILLIGGGENLNLSEGTKITLTEILQIRASSLQKCIAEMLKVFIEEVARWEANNVSESGV